MRPIDLRGLFDNLRVPWRDRGANTSRGNVNICCPFCRDDYGYHMTISETREGAYYCYRRPQEHSGGNLVRVLVKLGASRTEAISLINNFAGSRATEHAGPEIVAAVAPQIWQDIMDSDAAAELVVELTNDVNALQRLMGDPIRAARELGRLEAKIAHGKVPSGETGSAPAAPQKPSVAPTRTVRGPTPVQKSLAEIARTGSIEEYEAARRSGIK